MDKIVVPSKGMAGKVQQSGNDSCLGKAATVITSIPWHFSG